MRKEKWYGYEGPVVDELTDMDIEQQDFVDGTIYEMLCTLSGKQLVWDIDIIHTVFDTIREVLWERYKIRVPYASVKRRDCYWFNSDDCGDCNGTINDFNNICKCEEMFIEMAYECPKCKTGIINPTFSGTLTCDKCDFDKPAHEVAKIYPNIQNYL